MSQLHDRVHQVFRDVFDDDEMEINATTTADDVDGWDSLMHINLAIALEREFEVKFATAEISWLKEEGQNVGSLFELLDKKLS